MSFPRYPKYKDIGVEWLGEVPEHWGSTALKRFVDPSRPITYGIVQAGPDKVGGVPYIRPADMTDEEGVASPDGLLRTSMEIATAYTRSTIRPGDLVCSIGPSFGKVMVTPDWLAGANLTQGTARVAVRKGQHPRYVFWALRSGASVAQWESSVGGATFRALNLGPLAETILSAPPLGEQQAIAAFLDRETAKIDALIAEQQRLIELLQEKRQAVISHAVTKGLNPDAPMKDSGIEWLGEVPENWEEFPLGALLRLKHGFAFDGARFSDTGEYILMTPGNFQERGGFRTKDPEKYYEGSDFPSEFILASGQLLVAMTEQSPGLLGSALFVPDQAVYLHNQRLGLVQGLREDRLDARFLYHVFNSPRYRAEVSTTASGSKVRHTSPGKLLAVRVFLPPLAEQRQIVVAVDEAFAAIDQLCAEAESAIALLQERRSALISAAVTGQIDVRGLAGSEAA